MSTPTSSPTPKCDDGSFEFSRSWKYCAIIIVIICFLYVFIDFIRNSSKRVVPAKLIISRTFIDFIWALLFFYMIIDVDCLTITSHSSVCTQLGVIFAFLFLLSISYFSGICWDMYFTLSNPFRSPASDSWQIHIVSIFVASVFSIIVYAVNGYQYRKDYQICLTTNTENQFNWYNFAVIYLPLAIVVLGGLGVTGWAIKRLKRRMIEETFELRWSIIRRQITIVSIFTLNYFIAGCIWGPIALSTFRSNDNKRDTLYGGKPKDQPYLLSIYIVLTIVFDLIAWIAKDSVQSLNIFKNPSRKLHISSSSSVHGSVVSVSGSSSYKYNNKSDNNDKREPLLLNVSNTNSSISSKNSKKNILKQQQSKSLKSRTHNLSNALRKEVIAFITAGLAQSIKNTAKETLQTSSNSNYNDVWDDDFDNYNSFNPNIINRKAAKSKSNTQQSNTRSNTNKIINTPNLDLHNSQISELSDMSNKRNLNKKDYDDDDDDDILNDHSLSLSQSQSDDDHDIILNNDDDNDSDDEDDDDRNILTVVEPEPQQVYYPHSIRSNPSEHRGAMNRFLVSVDDSSQVEVPFTDFAPHVFRYLRTVQYGVSDSEYLSSIIPSLPTADSKKLINEICSKFSEGSGKSGAFFFYTRDTKYIIKTLTREEAQLLIYILKKYVYYFRREPSSYINKFFGLHSIKLYSLIIYFVVIENVFPINSEPQEKYDIKGSWIARHTNHHIDEGKLMKDSDLHKQLLLDNKISSQMYWQLFYDSQFLESLYIMDYSLLLGIYYTGIDPKQIDKQDKQPDKQQDNDDNNNDADNNEYKYNYNKNHLHDHFYRNRAQTYHTVMNNVGNSSKAIKAKMIEGPGIYYIGVIDILQKWNTKKILEKYAKIYLKCKNHKGISCVEPQFYRRRFLDKMETIGIVPSQKRTR